MDEITQGRDRRVTSGARAAVAGWLRLGAELPVIEAAIWADACAAVVEAGWTEATRVLLRELVDEVTADAAFAVLVGRVPEVPDELTLQRVLRDEVIAQLPPTPALPSWAEWSGWQGPGGTGSALFARDFLRLDEESDGEAWPPVSVMVYAEDEAAPLVLLEVSASGVPELFPPTRARRIAQALTEAADLVESAGRPA